MQRKASVVTIAESPYQPGRFALFRMDTPKLNVHFAWCGRALGWLPFPSTCSAFFHLYPSFESAETAIVECLKFPLRQEYA